MESKKINQLATEMAPATSDLTIIGDPITGVSKKITLLQIADLFATTGTVTSVAVTETGDALTITGSPITSAGTINIGFAGEASQYVRGDGALADFPTSTGGGSSVSYYLNSSVSQGTLGGVAYKELSKEPIIGAGTDITISANGYVASYITDANDPDVVLVPGGNFNCEFYFSVNSNNHNPYVYAELYKYDGSTFTLLGSSQSVPEYLSNGTTLSPYYFAIPVATAALTITDRLAIRIYVNVDGRVVTLHTENGHLCQVVTTLSKGMVSLNNLTDQSQFLATGTSGTNFGIVSSGDTHTFNLPVASATNTGKLSSSDWSTFNNKQNALTNPITGLGASGNVAYFDGVSSITSENSFNYDASTNRLGVNTSVPNATIGANAATDSGYSLLLKNDNANYNSIGFATDSTYGNMIQADRLGAAPSRNLTLYNYAGFISLTEAGNLGIGLLVPNTGIDIYHATQSQLWLHNAATGVSSTDGVRLALFNSKAANLRNFDGAMSISAEGDFSVITLGAENIRVNSVDGKVGIGGPATVPEMLTVNGSIQQSGVLSSLLKTNGDGKLIAAVAGTDYVIPSALSGYVPTSRTITINGTTQDLSANISYSVGTMGGSGVAGRVAYYNGTNSITSEAAFNYDDNLNRLGVDTISPNATIGANSGLDSGYSLLLKNSDTNYNGLGFRIDSTYGHMIETTRTGSAIARNLTLINNGGFFSVSEAGNFGFNILAVNTGVDIYASTNAQLWLHNGANTGSTQGSRLAYFSNKSLNLRNFEGPLSLSSEGDFQVITLGAENIRVNSANGYVGIGNPSTVLALLHVYRAENAADLLVQTNSITDYAEIAARNYNSVSTTYYRQYSSSASGTDFGLSRSNLASLFSNYASNFAIGTMNGGALILGTANTARLTIAANGESTFSSSVTATATVTVSGANQNSIYLNQNAGGTSSGYLIGRSLGGANTQDLFIYDVAAGLVRLAINTSGNVGIGTSSTGFNAAGVPLVVGSGSGNTGLTIFSGASSAGSIHFADAETTGAASYAGYINYIHSANSMQFGTNSNDRMTILSGGNVGIGTSSPIAAGGGYTGLDIRGTTGSSLILGSTTTPCGYIYASASFLTLETSSTIPILFNPGGTERARISSGGNVLIGTTDSAINSGVGIKLLNDSNKHISAVSTDSTNANGESFIMYSTGAAAYRFYVGWGGTIYATSPVISGISDVRLKENIRDIKFGLKEIMLLKPRDFDWKEGKGKNIKNDRGFIAQEFEEVFPDLIDIAKDPVKEGETPYKTIRQDLIPVLVKAIQELKEEIDILKNK